MASATTRRNAISEAFQLRVGRCRQSHRRITRLGLPRTLRPGDRVGDALQCLGTRLVWKHPSFSEPESIQTIGMAVLEHRCPWPVDADHVSMRIRGIDILQANHEMPLAYGAACGLSAPLWIGNGTSGDTDAS
jgi:hypothetical protein